ncbi:DUF2510 domain-containing protein [Pseudarthrobacter raffinosi]|uniref:DUF2510 domain-containing protein n=1 Tax=Pseudarthrobacter raffinosi TaxID=2953651 RepID=UPI00208F04E6|nr:DUF2510 domain-containing protein [Pseudarthrobacter sp. MDT3-9]MCO4253605.1 DUF2510 domain-containing protein [Pseudarthrobacter sp. MDT3-9]
MSQPPAGWYANPNAPHQQRWWDGTVWTEHVRAVQEGPRVPSTVTAPAYGAKGASASGNPAASTGFGLGLASMFLFGFPYVGVLLCLSAIVVSAVGLRRHRPGAAKKEKVLAIIGLVLGIVYTLMAFLWIATGRI